VVLPTLRLCFGPWFDPQRHKRRHPQNSFRRSPLYGGHESVSASWNGLDIARLVR
jgi:hypothetical protein